MLADKMGDGWNIQIDTDKYLNDFNGFTSQLKNNKLIQKKHIKTDALGITMYKSQNYGILYVKNPEWSYIGSNTSDYKHCSNSNVLEVETYMSKKILDNALNTASFFKH